MWLNFRPSAGAAELVFRYALWMFRCGGLSIGTQKVWHPCDKVFWPNLPVGLLPSLLRWAALKQFTRAGSPSFSFWEGCKCSHGSSSPDRSRAGLGYSEWFNKVLITFVNLLGFFSFYHPMREKYTSTLCCCVLRASQFCSPKDSFGNFSLWTIAPGRICGWISVCWVCLPPPQARWAGWKVLNTSAA